MHQSLSEYYKGKKVFVTGHTGFKGGWLIACLHLLGARVKGYALAPEFEEGIFNVVQSRVNAYSVLADIRDRERLKVEMLEFQPDFIFHLAAQPLVRRSYVIPAETFEVNVIGTANLLESLRDLKKGVSCTVITTDKVYENKEKNIFYREKDRLGGYDPYSSSKACTEMVVSSFRNSFFNPIDYSKHVKALASVRAGNVIGGGDWSADRLLPDIIKALQKQEVIAVRNPGAIRPWQHVLEPISGYLHLAGLLSEKPVKYSKPYNFGPMPKDHLSVKQVVKTAIKCWGTGDWKDVSEKKALLHESGNLQLSIDRARKELKWKPKLNSKEAIEWTVNWHKQPAASRMNFSFQQIEEYFEL